MARARPATLSIRSADLSRTHEILYIILIILHLVFYDLLRPLEQKEGKAGTHFLKALSAD